MYLSHLSLTHFRNYQHLELDLQGPVTLLQGQNAQGKTNLLEAIFFLATSKPVHAQSEREVVDWRASEEPIPYSRVAGHVHNLTGALDLEILLTARGDGVNFTKGVRINGVNRRSIDLVGLLRAVLFLPADIKLVDGPASERRHYLDVALCQIDRSYMRALSAYQKVVTQRNSLLRTLCDQEARPAAESTDAQLSFWDEQLVEHGSLVIARRQQFVAQLQTVASQRHDELSEGRERLQLHYLPSFNPGYLSDYDFARLKETRSADWPDLPVTSEPAAIAQQFQAKLRTRRSREIASGVTLYGPHRDDLRLVANDRDLRIYGSRGQQRTAALALKLAEVAVSTTTTGITPLLLLDDVMSELDAQRRQTLLRALGDTQQAIITTTDWDDFAPTFLSAAQLLAVSGGIVQPTGQ